MFGLSQTCQQGSSVGALLESLGDVTASVCFSITSRNPAEKPSPGEPCISFLSGIPLGVTFKARRLGLTEDDGDGTFIN